MKVMTNSELTLNPEAVWNQNQGDNHDDMWKHCPGSSDRCVLRPDNLRRRRESRLQSLLETLLQGAKTG